MPHEMRLPPSAASLSASMRDIGYSLETAVADLIDNSISANAGKIDIYCITDTEEPVMAIIDDGHGMGADELIHAMKHGGTGRNRKRTPHDLGKFGLGLKTASFSQCKRLTVVSRRGEELNAAEWDLDVVDNRDDWIISLLSEAEIHRLPCFELLPERGTMVLWRNLDRLFGDCEGPERQELVNKQLVEVQQHIALVFHRFMEGSVPWSSPLHICVNGHGVDPFDPFCRDHSATQHQPPERIRIKSQEILLQGYILPHHSKLSAQKFNLYKDQSSFFENQGVYVYRNCRLVAWGGWFRLIAKQKAAQLARVQIDFPSSLDDWWTIDIKKSRVQPPPAVRTRLRQILDRIITPSKRVYRERGQRLIPDDPYSLWERIANHTGIRYILNSRHPLIQNLAKKLDQIGQSKLNLLINSVGDDLPVDSICMDWNDNPQKLYSSNQINESITKRLEQLHNSLPEDLQYDMGAFRELVEATHLFDQHRDIVDAYIEQWQS